MLVLLKSPVVWAVAVGGSVAGLAVVGAIRKWRRKKASTEKSK